MTTLQGALPDATQVELLEYEDDCAICKVCLCPCFLELFHANDHAHDFQEALQIITGLDALSSNTDFLKYPWMWRCCG
jgi:hypothetical protein